MGNTGRPSTGCSRCRKRRIKCDERKPGCYRCEKLGEGCPGYAHGFWIFRDENDIAKRRALKTGRSRETSQQPSLDENADPSMTVVKRDKNTTQKSNLSYLQQSVSYDEAEDSSSLVVQPAMVEDIEYQSICFFMDTFTLNPSTEEFDQGFLNYLPGLYLNPKTDPSLKRAVVAVALNNFANHHYARHVGANALVAYGSALGAMNKSLRDTTIACSDSVLAAVYLLGLYEILCSPNMPTIGGVGWNNHMFGVLQLLRLRWQKPFKTAAQRHLFQTAHMSVLIAYMMAYMPPPSESMGFILGQEYAEGLGAKIAMVFFCKTIEVRSRLYRLGFVEPPCSVEDAKQLTATVKEAEALLDAQSFEDWTVDQPNWHVKAYKPVTNSKTGTSAFASQAIASYWLHHWTAIICLRRLIADILSLLEALDYEIEDAPRIRMRINLHRQEIEARADDILGSVDFCLNGFKLRRPDEYDCFDPKWSRKTGASAGALQLFWTVGTVKHTNLTTPMQRSLAMTIMKKIGTEFGIAQALLHSQ